MNQNDDDSDTGHPTRMAGAFFGRRKAKPLKQSQKELTESLLPELLIDISVPAPASPTELFSGRAENCILEIGFGGGEHMADRAKHNPQTGFIGCEPFVNGMAKALSAIDENGLSNIRLYDEDAARLLDWLPDSCLERVYLLYPDPWSKKRHWKRRFVSEANLARIHRVLQPGGEFRFASDIDHYVNWTLRHILAHGGFEWLATASSDWKEPWEGWLSTRYEQKAIREGRTPAYLIFRKSD